MMKRHIQSIYERFVMDDTQTRPGIQTPVKPATPITRPGRPIPTKRPGEKEQGKPMAEYQEMIDLFFETLAEIKDTPEGTKIIKNLYNKYAK